MRARTARDPDLLVWWGSQIERISPLARLERAAALDSKRSALRDRGPMVGGGSKRMRQLLWRPNSPRGTAQRKWG